MMAVDRLKPGAPPRSTLLQHSRSAKFTPGEDWTPARAISGNAIRSEAHFSGMLRQSQDFSQLALDGGLPQPADAGNATAGPAAAPAAPVAQGLPTASFTDFLTSGSITCCKDRGRGQCPARRGAARPGDRQPQNGMNLVATVSGHRPGVEYGFVQVIHFQRCLQFTDGTWTSVASGGPGADDSPVLDATCPVPDAGGQITMTDAPGFTIPLGSPAGAGQTITQRVNATNWVIAREQPGAWQRISNTFEWHSVTTIRRDAGGNWELAPGGNNIARGFTKIGGCPPPA